MNVFLATTGDGVAIASRGTDGHWSVDYALDGQDARCLATDPNHPGVVYAGTQGNGVWRSVDGGQIWPPTGLAGKIVKALAVSRTEQGTLFAGTKPALIFVSRDGGARWEEISSFRRIPFRRFWRSPAERPFTAYVQAIALSPTDSGVVVVGIEAGATVISADGGQTWSGHRPGALRDCHSLAFHTVSGDWVYSAGGTGGGAAVSRDAGRTWVHRGAGLDRHYGWACAADPARPETWYVSVSRSPLHAHSDDNAEAAIFRSTDGAWRRLEGGLPQPLDSMPYSLLTDPEAPEHVFAGLANGQVWHGTDHGDNWERLPFSFGAIHRALLRL